MATLVLEPVARMRCSPTVRRTLYHLCSSRVLRPGRRTLRDLPYPLPLQNRRPTRHNVTMASVPKFLRVLYNLLDTEPTSIIAWSPCGAFFQVHDIARLEQYVLPRYFKHNKFASFQRQLNNFGFCKWTKTRASVCTFSHDVLVRRKPYELPEMVAKSTPTASPVSLKRPRSQSPSPSSPMKKLKTTPVVELESDASDLLSLDWSVMANDEPFDEFCDDDSVGMPIELFFPESQGVRETIEPLRFGEAGSFEESEWRLLTECLA